LLCEIILDIVVIPIVFPQLIAHVLVALLELVEDIA
jgi:hypothetical protein